MLWFLSVAHAQECGVAFGEFEVRSLVERSEDALLRDDALAHARLFEEFVDRVPCLDAQLPKDAWARLLRGEAIVRRVQGKSWIPLLDTALHVWADLDVPPYLMEQFSPLPSLPRTDTPIPKGAVLFVDGVLAPVVPALSGEHVVQVYRDGAWRSAWVEDGGIPAELLAAEEVAAPVDTGPTRWEPASRGYVGAILGASVGRQMVEDPAEWLGDHQQLGLWAGAVSSGVAPLADRAGLYWDAALQAQLVSFRKGTSGLWGLDPARFLPAAYVGPAAVLEDISIGVGGGGFAALHYEGEAPVVVYFPQPDVSFTIRRGPADVAVNAGITPTAMHAGFAAGSISDTERPLVLRVGVDADLGIGWFREAPPGDRPATVVTLLTAFRLDAAWGRDR